VFDNIFTREYFEKKFGRNYEFIPYGAEVKAPEPSTGVFERLGVQPGEYFVFVGRFIPDKGLHLLVKAFAQLPGDKKLVLVGGSPNRGPYEDEIKGTKDSRIIFAGYLYGNDTNILIKNAYAYVQPSLIEGLSPVILTVMGLGTPLICSDIRENTFITKENAVTFRSGDAEALREALTWSQDHYPEMKAKALAGQADITERFNWDTVTSQYLRLFENS
jgi:glycosyltransferase involved in cell wall biosynthesis